MLNTEKEKKNVPKFRYVFPIYHDLQSCAKEKNYSSIKGLNVNLYCLEENNFLIQGLHLPE